MKLNLLLLLTGFLFLHPAFSAQQQGIIRIQIDLKNADSQTAKLWLPYPVSDLHQSIEDIKLQGNYNHTAVYREAVSGALFLYAEWPKQTANKSVSFAFKARATERKVTDLVDRGEAIPVEIQPYLAADWWVPAEGEVAKIAGQIKAGHKGILEKARAVYDWVVENTTRDPNIRGCGTGIVERTLAKRSGKCADLSSVYVALARNIGVPAREVFGLRLGRKAEQDITGGYHCWAEFYLPGTGWVPVDPSDVRKKMLIDHLSLDEVEDFRDYYFGAVDAYRIVLERGGRGIRLPYSDETQALNYLMYPYAEINGKAVDYFDAERFQYYVWFEELKK